MKVFRFHSYTNVVGLHCDFACLLFSYLKHKPSPETVRSIIQSAVECEKEFITQALPVSLIGMNGVLMSKYIEFVSDRLLVALGQQKCYNTPNPFEWMELISLQGKSNMFERKVTEYTQSGVSVDKYGAKKVRDARLFTLNADF